MLWTDVNDIAIELDEQHPDVDPTFILFTDLRKLVLSLEKFSDDPEKTNEKIGLKYTECTNLTLYFEDNKLDLINYAAKPKSITTPYKDVIEKERYLRGFLWRGNEQPKTKEAIFIE